MDYLVAFYAAGTGLLIILRAPYVEKWPALLLFRLVLLGFLFLVPSRGAPWEMGRQEENRILALLRRSFRLVRYHYPLLCVLFFFEEVEFTVNALSPTRPYWFEPWLYAWDRALFGDLPAVLLAPFSGKLLSEVMHAFYFAYYVIVIGGALVAWYGVGKRQKTPGPAFDLTLTSITLGYLLSFVHYPFLPARGPWENPELVSQLPPLDGFFFKQLIDFIIARGSVSGGCFPSSHVSASWAAVLALWHHHPTVSRGFAVAAAGMSFACVYTRYHHAVDVVAGLMVGLLAGVLGRLLVLKQASRLCYASRHSEWLNESGLKSRHFIPGPGRPRSSR